MEKRMKWPRMNTDEHGSDKDGHRGIKKEWNNSNYMKVKGMAD